MRQKVISSTLVGSISITENSSFKCPKCEHLHTESDYHTRLINSELGYIYLRCEGCKTQIGITSNIMGNIDFWLKEDEKW